ncbi:hypothetical protein [Povalibacter sp.]|uniref:hypothetical protein n=1 Tax=Povalibacter sp. TaxID=1962978 RepID=UPI002F423556
MSTLRVECAAIVKTRRSEVQMLLFFEEYAKHFALNFGQAAHGIRYFFSHPDADSSSPRGSLKHGLVSSGIRSKRVANDLLFAFIPPHWHHSREELSSMLSISFSQWFQYGYSAWRFTESGEVRADLAGVDRRWDPRCQAP